MCIRDRLTLEVARMIREDFLQQNAFTDIDGYSSYDRQEKLLSLILEYEDLCREAIAKGAAVTALFAIPAREKIGRAKSVPVDEYVQAYSDIRAEMAQQKMCIRDRCDCGGGCSDSQCGGR